MQLLLQAAAEVWQSLLLPFEMHSLEDNDMLAEGIGPERWCIPF
jgi:hypothetical protein